MATCGEDEFGNVYAEVCREEVGALRGFGSLYWACEDDSDSSTDITPEHPSEDFHSEASKEHCHQCSTRARGKLVGDGAEEDGKPTVIPSGSCKGVSPAQGASKHDHLKEISNSKHCLRDAGGATLGAEDTDTDSDDDLHIVLNPSEGVVHEGINEASEDGEDFVILAGDEAMNDWKWQEESCTPIEVKARAFLEGGEKFGTFGDEKGHNGRSPRMHPCIGYGSQVYHRHYRYVRGSGPSSVGVNVSARANGKPDRFGGGRAFSNCQRASLPTRGTGTLRGLSCGLEYSIPSNKTVFDVDIDALQEKPWRLSHVDVSDYFNFGFDEASWKNYCKQLAQFCLEITTQSKISVYESGRIGQSTMSASQGGRGCEPWSSANTQGLQVRESDAIFLIDAKDDRLSQSCIEGHRVDSGEVNNFLQIGSPKSDVPLGSERGTHKTAQPTVDIAKQTCGTRLDAEPQKCGAGSGNETQVNGSIAFCPEDGLATPSASRPKTLSPSTPPERIPTQDKRDTGRGKSQSSSLNDGLQLANDDYLSGAFHRNETGGRKETLRLSDNVKACGRQRVNAALTFCAGNCLSGRLDMKRCSSPAITSPLSKKRRLGSQKVNHGAHHSTQVVKKLFTPQTATAVWGAYKAYAKAEITQQKKHRSINNAVEGLKCDKSVDQYVNEYPEQPVAERKSNLISSKTEIKKSKGHGEIVSKKMNGQLQGIHCESAKEKSKKKLKTKKFKKGCKHDEKLMSKGCPNLEIGQVESFEKNPLIEKQGSGKVSMISFVSKDNCYYWKKVDNTSLCKIQDQDFKKLKSCQCHEIEQKTEAKNKTLIRNDCLLGCLEAGGDKEIKEVLKLNGNTQWEAETSWEASQDLKSKRMGVKPMVSGEYRLAPTSTESLANLIFETHARDSMHVPFCEQVSTRQKPKYSESKARQVICKHSQLEAEDEAKRLPDVAVPREQGCKKHHPKKLCKSSRRNFNLPIITCLGGQLKQDNVTLNLALVKDTEMMNVANGATSPSTCGRDFNDKDRKVDPKICQSEMHSTKACGSELPNSSVDILNGNSYMGFGTPAEVPNVSSGILSGKNDMGFEVGRLQENHSSAEGLLIEQESAHTRLSESSEEEVKQRGRSKFERWTSHSEQVTHDLCFDTSDTQKIGRISLNRKVQASKFGQILMHLDESAPEYGKQGENRAVQLGPRKKWTFAREQKGKLRTTYEETDKLAIRKNEQHLDQFVAKLEKRRERFKLPRTDETQPSQSPAEKESFQSSALKALPFTEMDRVAVKEEPPARKRCWGGG